MPPRVKPRAERRDVAIEYIEELMIAQAYADDQIVTIIGSSAGNIEQKWDIIWETCKRWEIRFLY